MKRRFAALWMAVLVCLCCGSLGGCRKKEEPRPAAQTQKEFQVEEAGEGALRVVTDMDWMARWYRGKTQGYQGQKTFARILEYFGGMPGGTEVQLEVLPSEDGSYQAALTRMRTEIMAGGGPDVFYLSGFGSCEDGLPADTLFPNPEHAMASGLFLPLDGYMEEAQFMEPGKLLDSVMEAGRYEGAQYILPMFYRLPMGVLLRKAGPEELPAGWEEAAASEEEDIQRMYAMAASGSLPGFREIAFGRIADNVGEELLLDRDTLFRRTREALSLYEKFPGQLLYEENNAHYWALDYLEYQDYKEGLREEEGSPAPQETEAPEEEAYTFFAPRGGDGDVIAAVEHWCAVSANTRRPEEAFHIADIMLSREFLSAMNFWNRQDLSVDMPLLGATAHGSIPVHTELLVNGRMRYRNDSLSLAQRQALKEAQESITVAYITSNVDRELDHMFIELRKRVENGESLTDEDILKVTDKCHSAMKMMLAES